MIKPIPVHIDIENDIQAMQNGQFTFTLRINNGEIVDYNRIEYVGPEEYNGIEQEIITELSTPYRDRSGSEESPVRDDNLQHAHKKRGGGS